MAGNTKPDHATIARFRRNNLKELEGLFVQILRLCAEAGLAKVRLNLDSAGSMRIRTHIFCLLLAMLAASSMSSMPASAESDVRHKTGYAYDDRFATYYQNSLEVPNRVSMIDQRLQELGLIEKMVRISPVTDPLAWIKKVHTPEHIRGIKSIPVDSANGATRPVGEIADLAVAYVLGAVRDVCEGKVENAFAAIRPPGHHVSNSGSLVGFCAYANAVIAARYAREKHGIQKILIVDWDYHYGNGTEYFILEDANSFLMEFGSADASPHRGDSNEVHIVTKGVGAGSNEEYEAVLQNYLVPEMKRFRPELIIISCGFDLKKSDSLGSHLVTAQGISKLTKILMQMAEEHCRGRIVSILEGGYRDRGSSQGFNGLSQCAENHVRTLMSGRIQPETPFFRLPGENAQQP